MTEPSSRPPFLKRAFCSSRWRFFWIPLGITIGSALASVVPFFFHWVNSVFAIIFVAGLIYFFVSTIVWFVKKQTAAGFASLACMVVSGLTAIPAILLAFFLGMTMEDDFAVGLSLPTDVELAEPGEKSFGVETGPEAPDDSYQAALRAAITGTGGTDPTISTAIPSLGLLQRNHSDLLRQYLAAHPGWRVYLENGGKHATRRWVVENDWEMSLHGYYSEFGRRKGSQRFQFRTNLGLSGKPWGRRAESSSGKSVAPSLSTGNSLKESYCFFNEEGIVVELFEQAETAERRMTKAAIDELENELAPLAASPSWETAKSLLPEGAVEKGKPSFHLFNAMQPGIYNADIRCNPGEPGQIVLKAWEITRNARLSEGRLDKKGSEFVGWSDNPEEQFLSEVHFTIYEGDWGQYYGARFEVWFQPDSGAAERKLMDSNWKIEGWMR